jgi:hypothetical protein
MVRKGDSGVEFVAEINPSTCEFVLAEGQWRVKPAGWGTSRTALWNRPPQPFTKRDSTTPPAETLSNLRNTSEVAPEFFAKKVPSAPLQPRRNDGGEFVFPIWEETMGVWQQLNTEDTINIDVARTQMWFEFGWNNSNGHVYQASAYYEYYYFWPTGWYEPTTSWERFDDDWFSTGIRTYAHYSNLYWNYADQWTYANHMLSAWGTNYFTWINWDFDTSGDMADWLHTTHDYYGY